ncbi:MAG TPA: sensor histidine kinase, partial [Candidatus Binatia bacterium]
MRLKTNIFLWVSLATVLPLTFLVLGATAYSERIYREKVVGEVNASLNNVIAEIDRRLRVEREMVLALTEAPAMRRFFPVLERAAVGEVHAEFSRRSDEFNAFLEAFQNIVPSLS